MLPRPSTLEKACLPNKKVVLPAVAATVLVLMLWLAFRDSSVEAPAMPRPAVPVARASMPALDPAPGPSTAPEAPAAAAPGASTPERAR